MSEQRNITESEVRDRLAQLREDPQDDGFRFALHRALVEAGEPEPASFGQRLRELLRPRAALLWPVAGVAAGVLTFFVLGALFPRTVAPAAPRPELALPATTVPSSRIAVIKIDFITDVAVESADFQISLPEGLAFYADGEELPMRSFEWTQGLEAGNNVIPIAVRGQKPGRYLVTAVARVGEQRIEHDVVLEVTEG